MPVSEDAPPLLRTTVSEEEIASVVSQWTGYAPPDLQPLSLSPCSIPYPTPQPFTMLQRASNPTAFHHAHSPYSNTPASHLPRSDSPRPSCGQGTRDENASVRGHKARSFGRQPL